MKTLFLNHRTNSRVKKVLFSVAVVFALITIIQPAYSQNGVLIAPTTGTADGSAMLEVKSNSKGLLIPRMTSGQRAGISTPAPSLLVYQTDSPGAGFWYYDGANWIQLSTSNGIGSWSLTGNAGTIDGTNFIGTTDNVALNFRVNNQQAGRIDYTTGNAFFGYQAGNANTTGVNNSAIGYDALYSNVTGVANTACGIDALHFNTGGHYNTAEGNTALFYNTTGYNNTACGNWSLFSNSTGYNNTAIGTNADVGSGNLYNATAIGAYAVVSQSNSLVLGNNAYVGIGTSSPVSKLHISNGLPTGIGALPANTVVTIDNGSSNNYITFRNTQDNGTYSGLQFQDNNVGGYIAFKNYTGTGTNDGTNGDYMVYGTYTDHIFQNGASETVNSKTETMRIKQNGYVGIGTASPATNLDVNGVINAAIGYRVGSGAANGSFLRGNGTNFISSSILAADIPSGSGYYIQNQYSSVQAGAGFWTAGNGRIGANFYVDGSVGIGTTGPESLLHIYGGAIDISPVTNGNYNEGIRIHPANNDYNCIALGAVAGNSGTGIGQWNIVRYPAANSYLFGIRYNGTDFLNITNGGNVGIGTLSPNTPLDVNGVINASAGYRVGNGATSGTFLRGNGNNFVPSAILATDIPGGSGNYIQNQFSSAQAGAGFWTTGNGRVGTNFYVDGNVGIGTINPSRPLQVQKTSSGPALMISGAYSGQPRIQVYGLDADANAWMGFGADMGGGPYEHSIYFPAYNHIGKLTIGDYDGTTFNTKVMVTSTGKVGIGATPSNSLLEVNGGIRVLTTPTSDKWGSGLILSDELNSNSWLQIHIHGNRIRTFDGTSEFTYVTTADLPTLGTVLSGSGAANYVSKFTGTNSIGNSQIYDNGTTVDMGTTGYSSGDYKLVLGNSSPTTAIFGASNGSPVCFVANQPMVGFNAYWGGSGYTYTYWSAAPAGILTFGQEISGGFSFNTAPSGTAGASAPMTSRMAITNAGNVGIGNTNPGAMLDVGSNQNLEGQMSGYNYGVLGYYNSSVYGYLGCNGYAGIFNGDVVPNYPGSYSCGTSSYPWTNVNSNLYNGNALGNNSGNIPLSNGTINTNLNADLLDGMHASAFAAASGSGNYIQNSTSQQSASFNISGTGTVGTLAIGNNWTLNGSAYPGSGGFSYSGNDVIFGFSSTGGQASVQIDGAFIQAENGKTNTYAGPSIFNNTVTVNSAISTTGQITSTLATGTKPLNVTSTTMCTNLNADMLDNYHYNNLPYLGAANGTTNNVAKFTGTNSIGNSSIYDNGNVGIGTASPAYNLDVQGTGNFTNNVRIVPQSATWAEGIQFYMPNTLTWGGLRWSRARGNSDGNWGVGYTALDATDDLVFSSNNGGTQIDNIIRLTKAGNVGVGTLSPGQKLDVSGNIRLTGSVKEAGTAGSPGTPSIFLQQETLNGNSWIYQETAAPQWGLYHYNSDDGSAVQNSFMLLNGGSVGWTNSSFTSIPSGSAASIILQSQTGNAYFYGNVGIGTTSPATNLDVNGVVSAATGYRIGNTATSGTFLRGNGTNFISSAILATDIPSGSGNYVQNQYSSAQAGAGFWTAGTGRIGTNFYVDGNVGIGTTGPGARLEVAGQIKITGGSPGVNKVLTSDANGLATWATPTNGTDVTGTGTMGANYITKWVTPGTTGTITNCLMYDNGTTVGIGTTNPAQGKLWVQDGDIWVTGNNSRLAFNTDDTPDATPNASISASQNGINGSSADLLFNTWNGGNFVEIMRIRSNGNVGIGTTNPSVPLQVQKTSSGPALMISNGYAGQPRIQVYGLDADANAWMGLGTDMGGGPYEHSIYFPTASGTGGKLTIGDYNGTTYNTRMTINASGNVGIGTSPSATARLQVAGDIIGNAQVFRAYMTSNFSKAGGTWEKVPFNSTVFNSLQGTFDGTNRRFTPSRSGYYQISVVGWSSTPGNGVERYALGVYKNGTLEGLSGANYSNVDTPLASLSMIIYMNGSTDYVEIWAFSAIAATWFGGNSGGQCMYWHMNYLGS